MEMVVLLVVSLNLITQPEIKIKARFFFQAQALSESWWLLKLLTFILDICIYLTFETFLCTENFSHSRDYGIYQDNVNCCGKKIFNKETEKLSGLSIC